MKLYPDKFTVDESRSNPMVVALQSPDCPINEICVYMAVGFGTVMRQCEHLKIEGEEAECLKEEER